MDGSEAEGHLVLIFLVAQEQKLGAMGHQALLEHSFEEITQIRNK